MVRDLEVAEVPRIHTIHQEVTKVVVEVVNVTEDQEADLREHLVVTEI